MAGGKDGRRVFANTRFRRTADNGTEIWYEKSWPDIMIMRDMRKRIGKGE